MSDKKEYMTVHDVANMLLELVREGRGQHTMIVDSCYYLARKDDHPEVDDKAKTVDLGLYTGVDT